MKQKILNRKILAVSFVLLVSVILVICTFMRPKEKPVVHLEPMWIHYDLDSAAEEAECIVYGKVTHISSTKIHEFTGSSGTVFQEYYKEITLEVYNQAKGESDNGKVTYIEMTGETDQYIYVLDGYESLALSDEVILFANENGAFLSPATLIRAEDGLVMPSADMLPENAAITYSGSMSAEEYMAAVAEILN